MGIERKSSELKDRKVRKKLINSCNEVLLPNGASEIAAILVKFIEEGSKYNYRKRALRDLYRIKSYLRKGFLYIAKRSIKNLIYLAATIYRYFIPKKYDNAKQLEVVFSDSFDSDKCGKIIKSDKRFEHILLDHSQSYYNKREKIAKKITELTTPI